MTAVPVFLVRAFHHGAILVNTKAGIATPKDLEGKRVGVNRGYTVTTGVWARGILQEEHGVDLGKITWVLSGDEHVAEYRAARERGADRARQEDGATCWRPASLPPPSASRSTIAGREAAHSRTRSKRASRRCSATATTRSTIWW